METIASLLDRLAACHDAIGHPIARFHRPGLSDEEIAHLTRGLPVRLPEEICELYRWRNGLMDSQEIDLLIGCAERPVRDFGLFDAGYFMPLQDAIEEYYFHISDPEDLRIDRYCFPLFGDCDYCQLVRCADESRPEGPILEFVNEGVPFEGEDYTPVVFANLKDLLRWSIACFEAGAYYMKDGCVWRHDGIDAEEMARSMYPDIKHWQLYHDCYANRPKR